jgi:hypothetical protein
VRSYVTARIEGKRIQHQLHLAADAFQRALQRFLERLAVRSRIVTKFFHHDGRPGYSARVVAIDSALEADRNLVVHEPTHRDPHSQDQGENRAPYQHGLAPTPCLGGYWHTPD